MKQKKITLLTVLLFLSIFIFGIFNSVNAAQASPGKNLNIKFLRKSGYGYELSNTQKIVWKIYEVNNDNNATIYCLKGGPGFGDTFSSTSPSEAEKQEVFTYNQYFNLREPNNISPESYKNALPKDESNYTALMWLLDNIYVPAVENASDDEKARATANKESLLSAAKKYADEQQSEDGDDLDLLTDDDIDAVQQLAIWHFTNHDDDYCVSSDGNFSFKLNSVKNEASSLRKSLSDNTFEDDNGWERETACKALFKYLVNTAESKSSYNYNNASEEKPIELEDTKVKVTKKDGKLILGPYKIKELTSGANYTLKAKVTNGDGSEVQNVEYLQEDKNTKVEDIKTLVGQNFYISIPENTNIKNVKLELSIKLYVRQITYWSETNPDPANNQPVVIVENIIKSFTTEKTYEDKVFDLSLRKFISSITSGEEDKTYQRTPDIKTEELANGSNTTAEYEHSKKPIGVSIGDIVTYTIRVYNEGELDGYVTSIKDHIPEQLEFLSNDDLNKKYGWVLSEGGKTVTTDITSPETTNSENQKEIYASRTQNEDKVLLKSFSEESLDYIDVQIRCKIKEGIDTSKKITNIAEIASFLDADKEPIIDRDSTADSLTNSNSKPEDNIEDDNLPQDTDFPTYKDTEIEKGD